MKNIKQVIVMRKDLNMRKGKVAAQAGHACVAAVLAAMDKEGGFRWNINEDGIVGFDESYLSQWLNSGMAKICLGVEDKRDLLAIYNKAKEMNLICELIEDAGITEFHGNPTITCLAFAPYPADVIDKLTGKLSLY